MIGRHRQRDPERGDVPGWALVTVTSAVATLTLVSLASPWLVGVYTDVIAALVRS